MAKARVGQVIWRDDGFGYSEKLGRSGEVASGTGGGRIWIGFVVSRENGIGSERR